MENVNAFNDYTSLFSEKEEGISHELRKTVICKIHDAMLSVPHLAQSYATHRYRLAAQAELSICEKCSTKMEYVKEYTEMIARIEAQQYDISKDHLISAAEYYNHENFSRHIQMVGTLQDVNAVGTYLNAYTKEFCTAMIYAQQLQLKRLQSMMMLQINPKSQPPSIASLLEEVDTTGSVSSFPSPPSTAPSMPPHFPSGLPSEKQVRYYAYGKKLCEKYHKFVQAGFQLMANVKFTKENQFFVRKLHEIEKVFQECQSQTGCRILSEVKLLEDFILQILYPALRKQFLTTSLSETLPNMELRDRSNLGPREANDEKNSYLKRKRSGMDAAILQNRNHA